MQTLLAKQRNYLLDGVQTDGFGQMSGIWPDVWDLARCLGFGQMSGIWSDVWDLARCLGFGKMSGIWPDLWVYL